jgi:uncharacterized protein (DUF983 family)
MDHPPSRAQAFARAVRLACPRCGVGPLFRGWFRMHDACPACGLPLTREPGFYLGSIYINYGATVIATGALYALLVLGLGASHETALGVCLGVAVAFPILFFRHARSFLLALDRSVNRHQSEPDAASEAAGQGTLSAAQLAALRTDDASAGCLMGVALALIILFGLGMAAVTLVFSGAATPSEADGIREDGIDLR